ncbi:MAG TPA: MlaD family protein [Kofleriaceae bacterium]|nr:MlaD family protein [Kofleriaceae bacterium]
MKTAASTHVKLGLFTVAAIVALIVAAVALGWRALRKDTVGYHTYFDESVQGLDVGSPVKFRGVLVGQVGAITVAPDLKHVDVALQLDVAAARKLGLDGAVLDLRTRLGTQGITGVKYVDIDFASPELGPPAPLGFAPAERYIPSRPSLMKGIESKLELAGRRLPELLDHTVAALDKLEQVLDDVHRSDLPARVAGVLDETTRGVAELRGLVRSFDRAQLPARTAASLARVDAAVDKLDGVLAQLGGKTGLVASAHRATDAFGDLGRSTLGSTTELERTLRDLDEAAHAIRDFMDQLEREPDMLVKGRARTNRR